VVASGGERRHEREQREGERRVEVVGDAAQVRQEREQHDDDRHEQVEHEDPLEDVVGAQQRHAARDQQLRGPAERRGEDDRGHGNTFRVVRS
jgi:hypothetical protein